MMQKLYALFGWTQAQIGSFERFRSLLRDLFAGKKPFVRMTAGALALVQLFCAAVFKTPVRPYGEALDLTGYRLVVCDEFEGDALNTDLWYSRGEGSNRCGYRSASQIKVENGNLILTGEYRDDETGAFGAGWYAGAVALREWYCKGYFEIRCICNKGDGFWSAFWLQSRHSYDDESRGGIGGAEMDIMEATDFDALLPRMRNSVTQTVYCNGSDDDPDNIDKCQFAAVGSDIYNTYNTYGMKWTDDEYIFYVNGVETARTSFGLGVSEVDENLIVSLELPEDMPQRVDADHSYRTQMVVDYVRVYQIAD